MCEARVSSGRITSCLGRKRERDGGRERAMDESSAETQCHLESLNQWRAKGFTKRSLGRVGERKMKKRGQSTITTRRNRLDGGRRRVTQAALVLLNRRGRGKGDV